MNLTRWCAVLLCAVATAAQAEERGYTLRELDLRARPFFDAQSVAKLAEKAPVVVIDRQGGWMQVKAGNQEGWVRLLSVRLGNPDPVKNDTSILSVFGAGRSQRPGGTTTVTTGVRGFSEEDLKAAQPNPEEVKKMEGYATGVDARGFAAAGGLSAQAVPYYDANGQPEGGRK
ncbi:MAG: SH3 domain-containing protein [Burkholderiales bacterium]